MYMYQQKTHEVHTLLLMEIGLTLISINKEMTNIHAQNNVMHVL